MFENFFMGLPPEQQSPDEAVLDCIINPALCPGGIDKVNLIDTATVIGKKDEPETVVASNAKEVNKKNAKKWLIGGLVLALVAGIAYWYYKTR